ncbi:Heterokaryon incompatibility protein 6, OR allele [Fusarium oxysporum f. sp. albedinis]|nr:Heterokaryon incompatibility protein 6, OR allele [Fusarium oxysporum f. sp. albedinis]
MQNRQLERDFKMRRSFSKKSSRRGRSLPQVPQPRLLTGSHMNYDCCRMNVACMSSAVEHLKLPCLIRGG